MKTIIIAEAGVNHNGNIKLAEQLIDVGAQAGVDFVKFQTFKTAHLVSKHAPKALYQKKNTSSNQSQYDMLKKLELDKKTHQHLIQYCQKRKVHFLSTAFDLESIDLLNLKENTNNINKIAIQISKKDKKATNDEIYTINSGHPLSKKEITQIVIEKSNNYNDISEIKVKYLNSNEGDIIIKINSLSIRKLVLIKC